MAITTNGVPLGLAAVRFWTRKKFKGTNALAGKVNRTRISIEQKESVRWLENLRDATGLLGEPGRLLHVGDRGADIYELFCTAHACGTHFLVRTMTDRRSGSGKHSAAKKTVVGRVGRVSRRMRCKSVAGHHVVRFVGKSGRAETAKLALKFKRLRILPPIGKPGSYAALDVTVIHAREIDPPAHRPAILWKLLTDLTVSDLAAAVMMLDWYALRWNIETYHKVLKSGCSVEKAKLQTAERLANFVAVCLVLSWRVFYLTKLNRTDPAGPATAAFTPTQLHILDALENPSRGGQRASPDTLSHYLYALARLGGYLNRTLDGPPGNIVLWRGLTRLTDLQLGYELRDGLVGN